MKTTQLTQVFIATIILVTLSGLILGCPGLFPPAGEGEGEGEQIGEGEGEGEVPAGAEGEGEVQPSGILEVLPLSLVITSLEVYAAFDMYNIGTVPLTWIAYDNLQSVTLTDAGQNVLNPDEQFRIGLNVDHSVLTENEEGRVTIDAGENGMGFVDVRVNTCGGEADGEGAFIICFADEDLESRVRTAIGKPTGEILSTDVVGVGFTELEATNYVHDLSGIQFLTDLTVLNLKNGYISDISLLANLTNLTVLNLSYNLIVDISPLAGLSGLTVLDLSGNAITDLSPLSDLTNLVELSLGENENFSDIALSDIAALAGLSQLTRLELEYNELDDISALSGLTNLDYLTLNDNNISDLDALVANSGLGEGDTVLAGSNPLSQDALCNDIPTLEARGVVVNFDGECVSP